MRLLAPGLQITGAPQKGGENEPTRSSQEPNCPLAPTHRSLPAYPEACPLPGSLAFLSLGAPGCQVQRKIQFPKLRKTVQIFRTGLDLKPGRISEVQ